MKLTSISLELLATCITGENQICPYMSGPQLVSLFRQFGYTDEYRNGLPDGLSRKNYAQSRIEGLNGTLDLEKLIEAVIDPRHFLKDKLKNHEEAVRFIDDLIKPDGYQLENEAGVFRVRSKPMNEANRVSVDSHFQEIRRKIGDALDKAQYTIWVAVAWLTDKELLQMLEKKAKQGLNVQVIAVDDQINSGLASNSSIAVYKVPPEGQYQNIMHNKFCVIDLDRVIQGSYNWTQKARFNDETIVIIDSQEEARKFAGQFIKLKQKYCG